MAVHEFPAIGIGSRHYIDGIVDMAFDSSHHFAVQNALYLIDCQFP